MYNLDGHEDGVNCLAVSSDDSVLVSGSEDHTARVWSIEDEEPVEDLEDLDELFDDDADKKKEEEINEEEEGTKNDASDKLKDDEEFAQERFKRDISVLNFFFDTPIITQIGLEMRVSMFDKLSAIGGTLGLYTGISIITIVETIWWLIRFVIYAVRRKKFKTPLNNNIVSDVSSPYK